MALKDKDPRKQALLNRALKTLGADFPMEVPEAITKKAGGTPKQRRQVKQKKQKINAINTRTNQLPGFRSGEYVYNPDFEPASKPQVTYIDEQNRIRSGKPGEQSSQTRLIQQKGRTPLLTNQPFSGELAKADQTQGKNPALPNAAQTQALFAGGLTPEQIDQRARTQLEQERQAQAQQLGPEQQWMNEYQNLRSNIDDLLSQRRVASGHQVGAANLPSVKELDQEIAAKRTLLSSMMGGTQDIARQQLANRGALQQQEMAGEQTIEQQELQGQQARENAILKALAEGNQRFGPFDQDAVLDLYKSVKEDLRMLNTGNKELSTEELNEKAWELVQKQIQNIQGGGKKKTGKNNQEKNLEETLLGTPAPK